MTEGLAPKLKVGVVVGVGVSDGVVVVVAARRGKRGSGGGVRPGSVAEARAPA